ncbi:MAG: lipid A biosynthesis acyltransferase [Desulfobacterales bacterium]|nr:MAG: lipid A biosynthesis acyltransferase [Desulfobacterales bacterium]
MMGTGNSWKDRLEALGHWFFYVAMRLFGHTGGYVLLVPVIFCYVLCSRKIHHITRPYLSRRFPGHGFFRLWLDTYKNLLSFGQVLVDRGWLGMNSDASLQGDFVGYDKLFHAIKQGRGVVLLTAHIGNWQTALAHLENLPVKVHALMQYDQQAVAKHYFDLQGKTRSFEIINADEPFGGMIDAAAALQRGEAVTIMGDRYVKGSCSTVDFLKSPVRIPDAAYMLAACANAPVVVLLAAKTREKNYQIRVWDPFYPHHENRDQRPAMLKECSEQFALILEKHLKQYPFQWYNFFDFWKQ